MKQFIILYILCLLISPTYAQIEQSRKPEGIWTECFGYDSTNVFSCKKGFATYYLNSELTFRLEDSVICNSFKKAATGRWEISKNKLTIFRDSNECMSSSSPNTYYITWVNNDTFYSTYISKIENPGIKSFTVFRRIK